MLIFQKLNLFHHFAKILLLHLAIWMLSDEGVELFTDILCSKGLVLAVKMYLVIYRLGPKKSPVIDQK